MITFFSVPRAARTPVNFREVNAARSWLQTVPDAEVLLFTDGEVDQSLVKAGVTVIGEFAVNEHGTPLLDDIFAQAEARARHGLLCYANSDIIFPQPLTAFAETLSKLPRFLLSGECQDFDLQGVIRPDVITGLWEKAQRLGKPRGRDALDFFFFGKGSLDRLPPFAVGRAGWDNFMPYLALKRGTPFIDATGTLPAIHQNHDYGHLAGGKQTAHSGPEALVNKRLMGEDSRMLFTLDDAPLLLGEDGPQATVSTHAALRYLQTRDLLEGVPTGPALRRWRRMKLLRKLAPALVERRCRALNRKRAELLLRG